MSYKYQRGQSYKSRNQDMIDKLWDQYDKMSKQEYVSPYQGLINSKIDQFDNNKFKFSYDPATDEGFQKYAESIRNEGSLAMEDTIGKITASTGGYGNSYAQIAGQAAYNSIVDDIGAAQASFEDKAYNRALGEFNNDQQTLLQEIGLYQGLEDSSRAEYDNAIGRVLDDIDLLYKRENADYTAWERDKDAAEEEEAAAEAAAEEEEAKALEQAIKDGDYTKIGELLGYPEETAKETGEAYYDELMTADLKPLTDTEIANYLKAVINGDTGYTADYLRDQGYDTTDINTAVNAYAAINNLDVYLDEKGELQYKGYYNEDINAGINGLDNLNKGQDFHIQMHEAEHGSKDNLNVQIGDKRNWRLNTADLYDQAESAGEGLFAYKDKIYYYDGTDVYNVDPQSGKVDEWKDLLKLLKSGKGRAGAFDWE